MSLLSRLFSLRATGSLNMDPDDPARPPGRYVLQRVAPGLGNIQDDPRRATQLRSHVVPRDPQTPRQLAQRATMRNGVLAWHMLPPADVIYWNEQAALRRTAPMNAFLTYYLTTHPIGPTGGPNGTATLATPNARLARVVLAAIGSPA
jgi:hypothetical protein